MQLIGITARINTLGVVILGLSMLVGSQQPLLGVAVAVAIPSLFALASSSVFRLIVIIAGALLVFQASANGPKFGYLALASLCFALSTVSLNKDVSMARITRPFVLGAVLVSVIIAISFGVSRSDDISMSGWFRDVLSYVLLVILPVVGIDAGRQLRRQTIDRSIVILGVLAAAGFATDYLNRRGVSSLGIGRFLLATPTLAALGFVHALVCASKKGTRTVVWMAAAVVIATLLIVTGTRTNLVLILAFPAVIGAGWKGRIPPGRLVRLLVPVVIFTAVLVPFLGAKLINNPAFLSGRLNATLSVLRGGSRSGDQSLRIREQQYQWAHDQFNAGPWLGTGPGHIYPNGETSLDTPWLVVAKFGILGTAAILMYLLAAAFTVIRSRRVVGYQYAHTTVRGWAVVLVFLAPFGPWTEDKGAALALALVMAMLVVYTREPEEFPGRTFAVGASTGRSTPEHSGAEPPSTRPSAMA